MVPLAAAGAAVARGRRHVDAHAGVIADARLEAERIAGDVAELRANGVAAVHPEAPVGASAGEEAAFLAIHVRPSVKCVWESESDTSGGSDPSSPTSRALVKPL